MQPVFEITMSIPVATGVFKTLVFRSDIEVSDLPAWILERGKTGESFSPVDVPASNESGTGEPVPRSLPLPGSERGFPLSLNARAGSRTTGEEYNLHDRLRELRSYLADLTAMANDLADELAESDGEDRSLNVRLANTHGHAWDFSREAKERRAAMFDSRMRLSVRFGKSRVRRRQINSDRRSIACEVDSIEKQIEKQAQARRKRSS